MEAAIPECSLFVTCTGCADILRLDHFLQMKEDAICCNIGHFDCELDIAGLNGACVEKVEVKPQVCFLVFNLISCIFPVIS